MNRVLLTGRLTRDPEMRVVSNGKNVTQFSIATNEYRGGQEKAEFHNVVTWDRLAQICSQYLGKGQLVAIEGRIHTRQWEDDRKVRHWKTEIVASQVEMLSGRKKRDYAAESAAEALAAQAAQMGVEPHELAEPPDDDTDDEDLEDDLELEPEQAEQLPPPGRRGGEDQVHGTITPGRSRRPFSRAPGTRCRSRARPTRRSRSRGRG